MKTNSIGWGSTSAPYATLQNRNEIKTNSKKNSWNWSSKVSRYGWTSTSAPSLTSTSTPGGNCWGVSSDATSARSPSVTSQKWNTSQVSGRKSGWEQSYQSASTRSENNPAWGSRPSSSDNSGALKSSRSVCFNQALTLSTSHNSVSWTSGNESRQQNQTNSLNQDLTDVELLWKYQGTQGIMVSLMPHHKVVVTQVHLLVSFHIIEQLQLTDTMTCDPVTKGIETFPPPPRR